MSDHSEAQGRGQRHTQDAAWRDGGSLDNRQRHFELLHDAFWQAHPAYLCADNWFGINVYDRTSDPEFKVYTPKTSKPHWILDLLSNLDMSGYTETSVISDTQMLRQTMKLYNRTNENMDILRGMLLEKYPMLREHDGEIRTLAQMPVNDDADYRYAALFFLGVNATESNIEALKFYFLTRHCPNPNKIAENAERDDELFLCCLYDVRGFVELCDLARPILSSGGAHLWQAAIDVAENGIQKRKLYLDGTDNSDLMRLAGIFDACGNGDLGDKLRCLVAWQEALHPALAQKGLAICKSDSAGYSVNLYYKEPDCGSS